MERCIYLCKEETESRKANGQYKKSALRVMTKEVLDEIIALKGAYYTSPSLYGQMLANRPRNKHGRRVLRTNNF